MNENQNEVQHAASHEENDDGLAQLNATGTRQKLDKLMTDFSSFDDVMRIGTRVCFSISM